MTQKTLYSAHGWLPYGVTDDSILLQVDMTSEAEMLAISATGTEELTATPTFDSVKGMTCGSTSAGWLITKLTGYADLDNEGQISIEVETSALTSIIGTSTGDDTSGATSNPTVITCRDTGNNYFTAFGINKSATAKVLNPWNFSSASRPNAQFDAAANSSTPTTHPIYMHSYGTSEFTTINIGWRGDSVWVAIDGKMRVGNETYTMVANQFDRIYIGSLIGSINYAMTDWYMRKLQISNRAPTFPVHPQLKRVITWSDSLFEATDSYGVTSNDAAMDNTVNAQIRRELQRRGMYCGWLDSDVNDGYSFLGGSKFSSVLASITAQNPDVVVCQMGTNDTSGGASFDADAMLDTATHGYKAIIDGLDAVCTHIIVCTVPPRTGNTEAIQTAVDQANTAIKTLPSYNSKVVVADVFTAMGGRNADTSLFFDDPPVHMDGSGMYLHGQEVAKTLLSVLGT